MEKGKLGVITVLFIILAVFSVNAIPVIPGEFGYGIETPAGRGGDVYKVTNLNDGGDGSLRACAEASGPRVCIFEVSGTIIHDRVLRITNPYLTIAGQTAPDPGITIRGAGVAIGASDVLLQHLRIRVGDDEDGPDPGSRDGLSIYSSTGSPTRDVVVDHVSVSWAIDEVLSFWANSGSIDRVTVTNSIISEALHDSIHPKGPHGMGALVGEGTNHITIKESILAFNNGRNPLIRDDAQKTEVINNLIYHPGDWEGTRVNIGSVGADETTFTVDVIGNVFIPADSNADKGTIVFIERNSPEGLRVYLEDNMANGNSPNNPWELAEGRTEGSVRASSSRLGNEGLTFIPSDDVENRLLRNAGARPFDRDAVDERIIESIEDRTGSIINSQNDVGGWPSLAQNRRELTIPNNPHGDSDGDGYTNLEEWLHVFAEGRAEEEFGLNSQSDDNTPPQRFDFLPTGLLPFDTTEVNLKVRTDEPSICHYSNKRNQAFGTMTNLPTKNGLSFSRTIPVETDRIYRYYIRCVDANGNENPDDALVTFTIDAEPVVDPTLPDTVPPVRYDFLPTGLQERGITEVNLKVRTREIARCHYSNKRNQAFETMTNLPSNNNLSFSRTIPVAEDRVYRYYIRCVDVNGNENPDDALVSFTTPPLEQAQPSQPAQQPQETQTEIQPVEEETPVVKKSSGGGGGGGGSASTTSRTPSIYRPTTVEIGEVIDNTGGQDSQTQDYNDENTCLPDIEFTPWSTCANNKQTRSVIDKNQCLGPEIQTRGCSLNYDESNNKFLSINSFDSKKKVNGAYKVPLPELDSGGFAVDRKVREDIFVVVDEKTGIEYLAEFDHVKQGKFFYTVKQLTDNSIGLITGEDSIITESSRGGIMTKIITVLGTALSFIYLLL